MQTTFDDDRTANDYNCPIPDCSYTHEFVDELADRFGGDA